MSTFSTDQADQAYQALIDRYRSLQEDIAYRSREIRLLAADIAHRQTRLDAQKDVFRSNQAQLRNIARKLHIRE